MSPDPDFNIDFPTVSSVLKSEIQTKLYEQINTLSRDQKLAISMKLALLKVQIPKPSLL